MKWKFGWPFQKKKPHLVILDDFFPNLLTGFRVAEYNAYLETFPDLIILSAYPEFDRCMEEYSALYPQFRHRIQKFEGVLPESCGLVYLNFLNNAALFLPAIEMRQVQFLMTLYPGGGFGLNEPESDAKLDRVLKSPLLRGIIVTQPVSERYVIERNHGRVPCWLIPGVVANPLYFEPETFATRPYFGESKACLDICFVAEKYMPRGLNKGYPEFIATAHHLASKDERVRFHVVGSFTPSDEDVSKLENRIRFLGRLNTAELRSFFRGMDLIVSPSQPFKLHPGNFDGFPTGCCVEASLCGVAVLATDALNQNPGYIDGQDILLSTSAPQEMTNKILQLLADPHSVAALGQNGQRVTQKLYAPTLQIGERLTILRSVVKKVGVLS